MSSYVNLYIIAEGQTEQTFVEMLLAPYLYERSIYVKATQIGKAGHKGGNVRFSRMKKDIEKFLKQRSDTFVSIFIDYYGLGEWPGLGEAQKAITPADKAAIINRATAEEVNRLFGQTRPEKRFIPYLAMHEFEALLFSNPAILAKGLKVDKAAIDKIIQSCGEPEMINNSPQTAPSKRLEALYSSYKKTVTGISIAEEIGIERMRRQCPLFNEWLTEIEGLPHR